MPDLSFRVTGARSRRTEASSQLLFRLEIADATASPIHSILLRCQVRIHPGRRRYSDREQERLADLFGTPDRWGQTVRDIPWVQVALSVPPFAGGTALDLPVPRAADDESAATRYLDGLEGGDVPLSFLFSGSVFYVADDVGPQVAPIPWDREAGYRLDAAVWKELPREPVTT